MDRLGNVYSLIDTTTGLADAVYEYDPYGNVLRATGSVAKSNPMGFSTKYTDRESDLVYYGMRYYVPEQGRFLNRDPIGEDGGLNLYAFVGSNPVGGYDFLGLAHDFDSMSTGSKHAQRYVPSTTDRTRYELGMADPMFMIASFIKRNDWAKKKYGELLQYAEGLSKVNKGFQNYILTIRILFDELDKAGAKYIVRDIESESSNQYKTGVTTKFYDRSTKNDISKYPEKRNSSVHQFFNDIRTSGHPVRTALKDSKTTIRIGVNQGKVFEEGFVTVYQDSYFMGLELIESQSARGEIDRSLVSNLLSVLNFNPGLNEGFFFHDHGNDALLSSPLTDPDVLNAYKSQINVLARQGDLLMMFEPHYGTEGINQTTGRGRQKKRNIEGFIWVGSLSQDFNF